MKKHSKLRSILQKHHFKCMKAKKNLILPYGQQNFNYDEENNDIPISGPVYTEAVAQAPAILPVIKFKTDNFQHAAAPILVIAQCFGLMPVRGLLADNAKKLRFSLYSFQTLYSLIIIIIAFVPNVTITVYLAGIGIAASNIKGILFYTCVQTACWLFVFLAARWPRLMRHWERTEMIFMCAPYTIPKRNLAKRLRLVVYTVLLLAFVEHLLYHSSEVVTYVRERSICAKLHNNATHTELSSFQDFIQRKHAHYLSLFPYHTLVGAFLLTANLVCTFVWNYMDIFLLMISKGICYRFEQITLHVKSLKDKATIEESVFMQIREHYVKLCKLLEYIDENISSIVMLTCINNLYFICSQLLSVFNKLQYPINYIYYWFSLIYLIGRAAFVLFIASTINEEAKAPLRVLRRMPSNVWCTELERLIFEIDTRTIAFSGKKFYFLTRTLIFGMAGTIVTYELVLMQFDEPDRKKAPPDFCT